MVARDPLFYKFMGALYILGYSGDMLAKAFKVTKVTIHKWLKKELGEDYVAKYRVKGDRPRFQILEEMIADFDHALYKSQAKTKLKELNLDINSAEDVMTFIMDMALMAQMDNTVMFDIKLGAFILSVCKEKIKTGAGKKQIILFRTIEKLEVVPYNPE